MTIWNTRQGHNDRVRVGPAETNLRRRGIWGTNLQFVCLANRIKSWITAKGLVSIVGSSFNHSDERSNFRENPVESQTGSCLSMGRLEQVFGGRMSCHSWRQPARKKGGMLDLFRLYTVFGLETMHTTWIVVQSRNKSNFHNQCVPRLHIRYPWFIQLWQYMYSDNTCNILVTQYMFWTIHNTCNTILVLCYNIVLQVPSVYLA